MIRIITIVAVIAIFGALAAQAGINNSAHDFRDEMGIDQTCIVCHTPHNAVDPLANGLDYAPLWNHDTGSTVYTLYTSASLNHTPGQPDGSTKLCLSCHDGSIAIDNYGGTTTGTVYADDSMFDGAPGTAVGSARDFGTSLDNDHPVSFAYDAVATADPEILPSTSATPIGGTIADRMLVDGKVQCSSCHDVHDVDGNAHLLVVTNQGSELCLTCHLK